MELFDNESNDKNAETAFIAWYEDICTERISMLEAEEGFKKRIEELECNNTDLLQAFNETQTEIKHVRSKYEPEQVGNDPIYTEPYNKILRERDKLKQDKADLQARLEEAERRINELMEGMSHREDSVSIDLPFDTPSDDLELPTLVTKRNGFGINITKSKRVTNTSTKGKIAYLITGKERIKTLENENEVLQLRLHEIRNENEILKLKIDALEKKIETVRHAAKAYVDSVKQPIGEQSRQEHEVLRHKKREDTNMNRDTMPISSPRNSYKSIFTSRKLSHKASSISLPAIRSTNSFIKKVDKETLKCYSHSDNPRRVESNEYSWKHSV